MQRKTGKTNVWQALQMWFVSRSKFCFQVKIAHFLFAFMSRDLTLLIIIHIYETLSYRSLNNTFLSELTDPVCKSM